MRVKQESTQKKDSPRTRGSGWVMAIQDAEREIDVLTQRIVGLKAAIRVCQERIEHGEPFPGQTKEAK